MKKTIALALVVILAVCFCYSANAAAPSEVAPLWENINTITNGINFNGTAGIASAVVAAKSGTTKITGTLTVYVQTDDGWEFVDDTTATTTTPALSLKVNFDGESKGYYKAVCSVTVTSNGVSETATKTAYKTCP